MRIELTERRDPAKLTPAGWACFLSGCVFVVLLAYQVGVWRLNNGDGSDSLQEKLEFLSRFPIVGIPVAILWLGLGIRLFVIDYRWAMAKEDRFLGKRSAKALKLWCLSLLLVIGLIWGF